MAAARGIVFHCVWSIVENVWRIIFYVSRYNKVNKKKLIAIDDGLIMPQLNSNFIIR